MYFNPAIECKDMNVKYRLAPVLPFTLVNAPNPTQLGWILFDNTHRRALQPLQWLLGVPYLKSSLVACFWRFCSVKLGFGLRQVAA